MNKITNSILMQKYQQYEYMVELCEKLVFLLKNENVVLFQTSLSLN